MQTETTADGKLDTWSVEEVAKAFDKGEIALIDVRTAPEYMVEHVEGALLLPMPFLIPAKLPSQEGKQIVFYCGSGKRSERVARSCLAAGLGHVAHMAGGFGAWKAAGQPYMATDMATGAPTKVPGAA